MILIGIDPGPRHLGIAAVETRSGIIEWADYDGTGWDPGEGVPWPHFATRARELTEALRGRYRGRWSALAIESAAYTRGRGNQVEWMAAQRQAIVSATLGYGPPDMIVMAVTPQQAKRAIAGNGRATKQQVANAAALVVRSQPYPTTGDRLEWEPAYLKTGEPNKRTETIADAIAIATAGVGLVRGRERRESCDKRCAPMMPNTGRTR